MRQTAGWHADQVEISIGEIATSSGCGYTTTREAIVDLELWRVIRRHGKGAGRLARFELLDPAGWKIGRTRKAIARRNRRRGGQQIELPLPGVAQVVEALTHFRVSSRDTSHPGERGQRAALSLRLKKQEHTRDGSSSGGRPETDHSRDLGEDLELEVVVGSGMPDRPEDQNVFDTAPVEPPQVDRAALAILRRLRAGKWRLRQRTGERILDLYAPEVAAEAAELTDDQVAEAIAELETSVQEDQAGRKAQAQADNMRHEGQKPAGRGGR